MLMHVDATSCYSCGAFLMILHISENWELRPHPQGRSSARVVLGLDRTQALKSFFPSAVEYLYTSALPVVIANLDAACCRQTDQTEHICVQGGDANFCTSRECTRHRTGLQAEHGSKV